MKDFLIKDFRITDTIGEGGMATVYMAEHQLLGNKVAIKILHEDFVANKNIRNRFIAEAKNMARMSHQNIIKVSDLIDAGDLVAFVMEYIEGQTLKEYLDTNGKLSDDEIKRLFVQMLDAVGYVHEQGLVHRDIKPSNFMISANGVVKLLDFGIAKNTDVTSSEYTMTGTTQNMGTPMYMSPEQIKSTKDVTHQTDIYSLGVVLWQLVTGRRPYNSNELSIPEIQVSILKDDLPLTKTKWDPIIKKAMQKSAELRYSQCSEMRESLKASKLHSTNNSRKNDIEDKTVIDNIEVGIKQKGSTTSSVKKKQNTSTISSNTKTEEVKGPVKTGGSTGEKRKISPIIIILAIVGLIAAIRNISGCGDNSSQEEVGNDTSVVEVDTFAVEADSSAPAGADSTVVLGK